MEEWERRLRDAVSEAKGEEPSTPEAPRAESGEPGDDGSTHPPDAPVNPVPDQAGWAVPYSFRPADAPSAGAEGAPAWASTGRSDQAPQPPPVAPTAAPQRSEASASGSTTMARIGEELVAWFKTLVSAAVYATLIVTFGFQVARVEGESMAPTLQNQDRLIVNKLAYRLHDPQVGDIVMLYYPRDPDKSFVKRVVAEPGDTIRSDNGHVYRNEVRIPDDFIPEEYRSNDTWGPEIIPDAQYFVMGDHRRNSSDSRTWKYVPKRYIIGKVQLRWWPIDEARVF